MDTVNNILSKEKLIIEEQIKELQEENAKMEYMLKKLNLLSVLADPRFKTNIDKLTALQSKYGAKECSTEAIGLSIAEKQHKVSNYLAKIKICTKIYMNLNLKLAKDIKISKSEIDNSKKTIKQFGTMTKEELESTEVKIKRYENELLKFEKKYPWLKDEQFNLPNIIKEIDTLNVLRDEKNKLLEELNCYQGLKPDISEARQQLIKIKNQYHSQFKSS